MAPIAFIDWSALFSWANLGEILALLFGLLILYVSKDLRNIVKELDEVIQAYTAGKEKDSPGGKELTKEEKAKFYDELLDVFRAILNHYLGKTFTKIGRIGSAIGTGVKRLFGG